MNPHPPITINLNPFYLTFIQLYYQSIIIVVVHASYKKRETVYHYPEILQAISYYSFPITLVLYALLYYTNYNQT